MHIRTLNIVALDQSKNDYGVYASHQRNVFGTPLVFRGTLDECLLYRSIHQ